MLNTHFDAISERVGSVFERGTNETRMIETQRQETKKLDRLRTISDESQARLRWKMCKQFAKHMVAEGPFDTYDETIVAANNIWFNKVDVNGWLEAFAAHPQIGQNQPSSYKTSSTTSAQWSKGEQSTALATATDSTLQ
ncbi:uric acid degradation bifunctional protein TTL isoform X2, partial [Tanacetum coccineum]